MPNYPPNAAHFDGNQVPTNMGVVGTLGTADTRGTALPLPFAVDPTTGAAYVNILQGSINIGTVAEDLTITAGTLTRVSTIGTLENGTVTVGSISNIGVIHNAGTIAALPTLNLTTGTLTTGSLSNVAMLHAGTLTTLPQISVGTLPTLNLTTGTITTGSLTNIAMLHGGTVNASLVSSTGTIPLVTTVSNLTNGSINILTGTIQNSGTTTGVGVVTALTNGSINVLTGTVTSVSNLAAGTVTALAAGTITNGTINIWNGGTSITGSVTATGVFFGTTDVTAYRTWNLITPSQPGNFGTATVDFSNNSTTWSSPSAIYSDSNTSPVNTISTWNSSIYYGPILGRYMRINMDFLVGTISYALGLNSSVRYQRSIDVATLGTIQNLNAGTLTSVTNLAGGTVQINEKPVNIGTSYGTLGTAGAATWGTLIVASGAGTYQYVSGLSIVVASGTVDCAITNVGTVAAANGAGILARGQFTPGGGIARTFMPVERSGTNGTIGYWLGGAGSAYFTVNYWQAT